MQISVFSYFLLILLFTIQCNDNKNGLSDPFFTKKIPTHFSSVELEILSKINENAHFLPINDDKIVAFHAAKRKIDLADFDGALKLASEALKTIEESKQKNKESQILWYEYHYLKNFSLIRNDLSLDQTKTSIKTILTQCQNEPNNISQYYYYKFLLQLAHCNLALNNNFVAINICFKGITHLNNESSPIYQILLSDYYETLARSYTREDPEYFDLAITYFKKNMALDQKMQRKNNISASYIALLYAYKNHDSLSTYYSNVEYNKMSLLNTYYCYQNLSLVNYYKGDLDKAQDYQINVLKLMENNSNPLIYMNVLSNLASLYLLKGETKKVEATNQRIKDIAPNSEMLERYRNYYSAKITSDLNESKNAKVQNKLSSLLEVRKCGAELSFNRKDFHLSDFFVENCTSILQLFNKKILSNQDSSLIDIILNTYSDSHSRSLNNTLSQTNPSSNENKIEELLAVINDFKDTLSRPEIYDQLFLLYNENQTKSPGFDHSLDSNFIHWKELKSYLEAMDKCMIFTIANEDEYFIITATKDGLYLNNHDRIKVNKQVNKIRNALIHNHFEAHLSDTLSQMILIPELSRFKEIIIFPDDELNNIPFEVLTINGILLIESMIISQHYNIEKAIHQLPNIFYPSDMAILSYSNEKTIQDLRIKELSELSYGYEEAKAISMLIGSNKEHFISGNKMNLNAIHQAFQMPLLHLVSHAFSNPRNRRENYFYCREQNKALKIKNAEILHLPTVPKFLFLSACESGIGSFKIGEGNFSLTRAFIEKGTATTIHTLWKINDQQAKEFTTLFYKNWFGGESAAIALTKSKIEFMSTHASNPFLGCAFTLTGNTNAFLCSGN